MVGLAAGSAALESEGAFNGTPAFWGADLRAEGRARAHAAGLCSLGVEPIRLPRLTHGQQQQQLLGQTGLAFTSGSSNLGNSGSSISGISGISGISILGALKEKDGRLKAGASSAASCSAAAGAAFSTGFRWGSAGAGTLEAGAST